MATLFRCDTIIRNATIIDGTGAPRFQGDVAVSGDRIVSVGDCSATGADSEIDGTAIENRQRARQADAHRARVRVGRRAERGRTAAEDLRGRQELGVNLQPDDGLELPTHHSVLTTRLWVRRRRPSHRRRRSSS